MGKAKKLFVFCIIFIMSVSMVSCGKASEPKKVSEISGKINIWATKDQETVLNDEANTFKQKNGKVKINITVFNNSDDIDKAILAVADKSEDLPDMITSQDIDLHKIVDKYEKNLLEVSSISGFKKTSFSSSQIYNDTVNDKIYAIPWYTDPLFMVYREDIFNALGVKSEDIKTWQEFSDVGKDKFISNSKYMLALNSFRNSMLYNAGLNQLSVNYYNKDGKLDLLNNSNIKPAVNFYNIYQNKLFYDESKGNGEINSFLNGNTVALLSNIKTLTEIETKYPELKGKLNVEKLPAFEEGGNRNVIGCGTDIVPFKVAANNSAAIEFIKYLTMDKSNAVNEFKKYSYIASNIDIMTDTVFYKKSEFYNKKSIGQMAIDEVAGLRKVTYSKDFGKIRGYMLNTLVDSAVNNKSLNDSVLNLQKSLNNDTTLK